MSRPSRGYMRIWNGHRREYKRIWMWNKRHPNNQKELPKVARLHITKEMVALKEKEPVSPVREYGNHLWKQLLKEDEEWRRQRGEKA